MLIRLFLVLLLVKCTTKLCIVIVNNESNILKSSNLLIRDLVMDEVLIRLFIVLFLRKFTILLCMIFLNHERNFRKVF